MTPEQKTDFINKTLLNVNKELSDIVDIVPPEKHWMLLMAMGILSSLMAYFNSKTSSPHK